MPVESPHPAGCAVSTEMSRQDRAGQDYHDQWEVTAVACERITIDHEKMGGLPCLRDLRIPVGTVLGRLAAGRDAREDPGGFP
jgi:hypothetical protein